MSSELLYPTIRENRFGELIADKNGTPFLVVFTANWLGEDTIMEAILKQLARQYEDQFKFYRINTDISKELTFRLGIFRLPTLMFFDGGEVVHQIRGMKAKKLIQERIEQILANGNSKVK